MSKPKLEIKETKEVKGRLEITLKAPENPPCKTCNKTPRRNGSAYCGQCSINFHSGL